jgi:AbrB family looped-hinge helix DNA binding protein
MAGVQEYVTTVTQRGQVTIPAEVRRLLGAKPRSKVTFRVDGDEVSLVASEYTLESAFGSVTPITRPENFEQLSRIAKDEKAARTVRKLRRQ